MSQELDLKKLRHRAEQLRRLKLERSKLTPLERLIDHRFKEQKRFVLDESDFICALCTRRAGKSTGLGFRLYRAGLRHPNSLSIYIALTRDSAKSIMWPVLHEINRRFQLGAVLSESDLTATLPNGSMIRLVGADMKNFIERLRGPKYAEAQIDEAGSFRSHISTLVDDILTPALGDYRGSLVITGTPGPIPSGLFYEASTGKIGYSVHEWGLYDNPYFPNPEEFVTKIMEKKGWTNNNPTFKREYMGKWVIDLDALVYKFKPERNLYDSLPEGHQWRRILAVDYGWNDQTAFSVVTYSETHFNVFVEHAEGHSELIPSNIAKRLGELRDIYKPIKIIADTGGLGKTITEEFIQRYHIAIEPAEKREKLTFISMLNGDFVDGRLYVHRSLTDLQNQYLNLQKAENPTATLYEMPGQPNDLCDATLYAYRKAKHFLANPIKRYKEGSDEYYKQLEKDLEQKDVDELEKKNQRAWWESL